jgi:hypothetical protein
LKQHTTPCSECPFRRTTEPGHLGGSSPLTYVGQAYGPFFLPCHSTHDYKSLEARLNTENLQCAGAAIHRANIGRSELMPDPLLKLPADTETVFATQAEFLAHHGVIEVELAQYLLSSDLLTPETLMRVELNTAEERARKGEAFVQEVPCKPKS